jgi:hypothetical protein
MVKLNTKAGDDNKMLRIFSLPLHTVLTHANPDANTIQGHFRHHKIIS